MPNLAGVRRGVGPESENLPGVAMGAEERGRCAAAAASFSRTCPHPPLPVKPRERVSCTMPHTPHTQHVCVCVCAISQRERERASTPVVLTGHGVQQRHAKKEEEKTRACRGLAMSRQHT
eukprot:2271037-Rhodomonas_salina.1